LLSTKVEIQGFIFLSIITIAIAKHLYLIDVDESRNFNILIDKEGIKIREIEYKWADISETAILYLPIRRNGIYYLIILFNDETYEKFDVSNFRSYKGFTKKLSAYIEYFKQLQYFFPFT
jgi:hypothetical protein